MNQFSVFVSVSSLFRVGPGTSWPRWLWHLRRCGIRTRDIQEFFDLQFFSWRKQKVEDVVSLLQVLLRALRQVRGRVWTCHSPLDHWWVEGRRIGVEHSCRFGPHPLGVQLVAQTELDPFCGQTWLLPRLQLLEKDWRSLEHLCAFHGCIEQSGLCHWFLRCQVGWFDQGF